MKSAGRGGGGGSAIRNRALRRIITLSLVNKEKTRGTPLLLFPSHFSSSCNPGKRATKGTRSAKFLITQTEKHLEAELEAEGETKPGGGRGGGGVRVGGALPTWRAAAGDPGAGSRCRRDKRRVASLPIKPNSKYLLIYSHWGVRCDL